MVTVIQNIKGDKLERPNVAHSPFWDRNTCLQKKNYTIKEKDKFCYNQNKNINSSLMFFNIYY